MPSPLARIAQPSSEFIGTNHDETAAPVASVRNTYSTLPIISGDRSITRRQEYLASGLRQSNWAKEPNQSNKRFPDNNRTFDPPQN